jgi:hypothetical protein
VINAPERVEVPKKTTHAPYLVKRGRIAQTKKDNTPNKRLKKREYEASSKDSECESTRC